VGIMSGRAASLVADGSPALQAQAGGLHTAFQVATVVAAGAVVCALFLTRTDHPAAAVAPQPEAEAEPQLR